MIAATFLGAYNERKSFQMKNFNTARREAHPVRRPADSWRTRPDPAQSLLVFRLLIMTTLHSKKSSLPEVTF